MKLREILWGIGTGLVAIMLVRLGGIYASLLGLTPEVVECFCLALFLAGLLAGIGRAGRLARQPVIAYAALWLVPPGVILLCKLATGWSWSELARTFRGLDFLGCFLLVFSLQFGFILGRLGRVMAAKRETSVDSETPG